MRETLKGGESRLWREAMNEEVRTSEDMRFCKVEPHPVYENVMYTTSILKKKEI